MAPPTARRWLFLALPLGLAAAAFVAWRGASHDGDPTLAPEKAPATQTQPAPEPSAALSPVAAPVPPREQPTRHDPAPSPASPGAPDPAPASEAALMDAAARAVPRDPQRALTLIEEGDRRFGSDHEQRRRLEIEALVGLEQIGRSHAKAEQFYRRYPDSSAAREIERLTGYHPRPWGPGGR